MTPSALRRLLIVLIILILGGGGAWFFIAHSSSSTLTPHTNLTQKPATLLNHPADLVTPLGQGYLFLDKTSRGLFYADAAGTISLNTQIGLTTDPNESSIPNSGPTYNTVVYLEAMNGGGVVVTTTRQVFIVRSTRGVISLPTPNETVDFTASAYDSQTNTLFLLASYSKNIYRYDLGKVTEPPSIAYKSKLEINRLAAGGGKLAAYFDAVPTIEAVVLEQYSQKRQLTPLLINASTGTLIKEISNFAPVTYLSISGNGQYLAIKKKLASTITAYQVSNGQTVSLPSYDTGGIAWLGNTLYLARDKGIWTYDPAKPKSGIIKIADVSAPITRLITNGAIVASTNTNVTSVLIPRDQTKTPAALRPPSPIPNAAYLYLAIPPEVHND